MLKKNHRRISSARMPLIHSTNSRKSIEQFSVVQKAKSSTLDAQTML